MNRNIQISVFKDTKTLQMFEKACIEREREKEQVQIFVRRNRLFFVYPLGEKGTPERALLSPVVRNERTDEVSINSGCVTEIRETNMYAFTKKKKVNVATLIYILPTIKR